MQGIRPGRLLSRAAGLDSRRRGAPRHRERRVPRRRGEPGCTAGWTSGCQGGEASILPALSKNLGLRDFHAAQIPKARGCCLGAEARSLGSRGAAAPAESPGARGGGAGSAGRRPRNPTPPAAAYPRGHRPRAAAPARGWREMRRRCRSPAPPPRRSAR